ncbi:MAG: type II toxin-antitoxin system mRNA interferase toxin, RelE/StbE family [Candidatus Kapabacteria bacterium]|nr:type II toxin-antitoxin system mRNA interferase toxin, RelE/StbE family [Candidatus Kapabacteria bacterium]
MIDLVWSNKFTKKIRKITKFKPELIPKIELVLCKLEVDPFDTSLSTHKLKGKLNGSLACTIDYDYRLIFEFQTNIETLKTEILLSSIGTHDEVY